MQHGDREDADEMARDFVQVVDDLAYAKTFYPQSRITRYLNAIASKIYLRIYQNRKEESNRLLRFWKIDVPMAIARHYRIILFSAFVFLLFYAFGFLSAKQDESFVREVLGDNYVDMTQKNIDEGNPFDVYKSGNAVLSWLGIMVNNIMVSLIAFVKGIIVGVFSLKDLVSNAIMVGVFQEMFSARGLTLEFFLAVMIHGLLELTAIVIACAAGVIMGTSYLFPGTLTRLEAFKRGAKDGVTIVIGLVPVFALAAFFEGFITGLYKMPLAINIILLAASASFIAWYFIIYPFRLYKRSVKEQVEALYA